MSMQNPLLSYFAEEKAESAVFVLMGVVALVADLFAEKRGDEYLKQVRGLSAATSASVTPLQAGSGTP
jgi:hypothetical protein